MIIPWLFIYTTFRWALRLGMFAVLLRRRAAPAVTMAWLGFTYFLPEAGVFFYILIGDRRLSRKRVRLHRQVIRTLHEDVEYSNRRKRATRPLFEPSLLPIAQQAERSTGMPIIGGNNAELLADNVNMIERLLADIDAAKHHVHLLYYIFEPDATGRRIAEALARAHKRGVTCRVLADAAGSRALFRSDLPAWLKENGIHLEAMLPVALLRRGLARIDLRNHRKLAVIDGVTAFTGSQNIADPHFGPRRKGSWIDLSVRLTGPVVTELQTVFVEDWAFDADEVLEGAEIFPMPKLTGDVAAQAVPTGPNHETESLPRVMLAAIYSAQSRIIISSPYLAPDEPMMLALAMAADRGVEVNIIVPLWSDHVLVAVAGRSYFRSLMESGVHIYHHTSGVLHAKTLTVDDTFGVVGSANLDIRSFYLCFELNVLLYGKQVTEKLLEVQRRYMAESTPVVLAGWCKRPFYKTYCDNIAGLLSPIL